MPRLVESATRPDLREREEIIRHFRALVTECPVRAGYARYMAVAPLRMRLDAPVRIQDEMEQVWQKEAARAEGLYLVLAYDHVMGLHALTSKTTPEVVIQALKGQP